MKSARILTALIVAAFMGTTIAMVSCGGAGSTVLFDGTWTLDTTPIGGNPRFGDGSYTLSLILSSDELERDIYAGDGFIDGVPYKFSVRVNHQPDESGYDYYLFIYQEGETPPDEALECRGNHTLNNSAGGQYEGGVGYESYGTGTFTTIRVEGPSE